MPTVSEELPNAPEVIPVESEEQVEEAREAEGALEEELRPKAPVAEVGPQSVAFVWSGSLPETAIGEGVYWVDRLLRGYRLLEAAGTLLWREVQVIEADEALGSLEALNAFHDEEYLQAVAALSEEQASRWSNEAFGFSEKGTHAFPGMADIAGWYVAAARSAMQVLLSGQAMRAVSLAGGQPHARRDRAESGDIFNDVLLALLDARAAGHKVAFLNLEAEHPIVVEEWFINDPGMLMISMHEGPDFHYPGTGFVEAMGERAGHGFNVNIPLPPGAGDREYRWAFEQIVPPLFEIFEPDIVVLLAGSSTHFAEPLAHLRLTSAGYQVLIERISVLAPRLVMLGGGGSDMDVSARLWAIALGALTERLAALPRNLPADYASEWGEGSFHDDLLPALSSEMQAYVTERTRRSVFQLQRALFPLWGLPVSTEVADSLEEEAMPYRLSDGLMQAAPPAQPSRELVRRRGVEEVRTEVRGRGASGAPLEESAEERSRSKQRRDRRVRKKRGREESGQGAERQAAAQHEEGSKSRKKRRRKRRGVQSDIE
ncbi:MAG: hypothetical protein M3220_19325 [Chloroflexota bacterium]|nr:hypothetical protein [Chloroflexota bacterium]